MNTAMLDKISPVKLRLAPSYSAIAIELAASDNLLLSAADIARLSPTSVPGITAQAVCQQTLATEFRRLAALRDPWGHQLSRLDLAVDILAWGHQLADAVGGWSQVTTSRIIAAICGRAANGNWACSALPLTICANLLYYVCAVQYAEDFEADDFAQLLADCLADADCAGSEVLA